MDRADHATSLFVLLLAAIFVSFFATQFAMLFTSDAAGLSVLSGKLPYWDFTMFWSGGRLALDGHIATIFDAENYGAWLRDMFNPHLTDQVWSYPPSMLLVTLPFAVLPIGIAYFCWQGLACLALFATGRFLALPLSGRIALVLSPAALMSALLGQNGLFTGALLIASLSLLPRRPALAGVLIGLLTLKPQLGILLPFCLLASRNYVAIASATITAVLLFALTGLAFGFDVWGAFWTVTRPAMTGIMDAPFPQGYQVHTVTVFAALRALGASIVAAQVVQGVATLGCILVCWHFWRPGARINPVDRVCLTGVLALLATPYAYDYDSVPLCSACLYLLFCRRGGSLLMPALGLAAPLLLYFARRLGVFVDPLVALAVAGQLVVLARHSADTDDPRNGVYQAREAL